MSGIPVGIGDPALPYRRAIRLHATTPNEVVADLEDDFHRFRVVVEHRDHTVTAVIGESIRYPWSTCPASAEALHTLEGAPLSVRMADSLKFCNPRTACTHQHDLALLGIAHAAAGRVTRRYDAEIPAPIDGERTVRLWRDATLLLTWRVNPQGVLDPTELAEVPWRGGFQRWADANLSPDDAEAAIVLRRASEIGLGRGMELESYDTAEPLSPLTLNSCFTMQESRIADAARMRGSVRDFGSAPTALLNDS